MKIGDEVYVHGYVDEIRKGTYVDIVIIRNNGGYFGTDASEVILADRKTENSSEKPNNCETCKHNKLEWYSEVCDGCSKAHSKYEPKTEPHHSGEVTEMVEPQTDIHGLTDCDFCKHNSEGWGSKACDSCCESNNHFEPKTEPQTRMTEDDAFYIVFKDLTKDEGLFTGRYDAKHGSKQYMHGVSSVMEYIAYKVGEDCLDAFNEHFVSNLIESEEKAERSE